MDNDRSYSTNKDINLCIIESIIIQKDRPMLSDTNLSFPLKLL